VDLRPVQRQHSHAAFVFAQCQMGWHIVSWSNVFRFPVSGFRFQVLEFPWAAAFLFLLFSFRFEP